MEPLYRDMAIPPYTPASERPLPEDLRIEFVYEADTQRLVLQAYASESPCIYQGRGRFLLEGSVFRQNQLSLLDPFLTERRFIYGKHLKIVLRALIPKLRKEGVHIRCDLEIKNEPAASVQVLRVEGDTVVYRLCYRAPAGTFRDITGLFRHVISGHVLYQGSETDLRRLPQVEDGEYTASGDEAEALARLCETADYLFSGMQLSLLHLLRGRPEPLHGRGTAPVPAMRTPSALPVPARERGYDGPVWISSDVRPVPRPSSHRYVFFVNEARRLSALEAPKAPYMPFSASYPTYDAMNADQRAWYFYWRHEYLSGNILTVDLSYVFVFLYECINGASGPPQTAYSRMLQIYRQFRSVYPALDRHVPLWCLDMILVFGLDESPDDILAEADISPTHLYPSPDLYFQRAMTRGLHTLPFSALCAMSAYDIRKSRFYAGHEELIANTAVRVFCELEQQMQSARGQSLADVFAPEAVTHLWDSFSTAVCGRSSSYRIRMTYRPYSRSERFRAFIGGVLRHMENLLRKREAFPGRLKAADLHAAVAAAVERAVLPSAAPAPRPFRIAVDMDKARALENDSWENTLRLLEAAGGAPQENKAPPEAAEQPAAPTPVGDSADDDPVAEFINRLSPLERGVLDALVEERPQQELAAMAAAEFTFPEAVIQSVNELFLEFFGDVLIESDPEPRLVEEYRQMLKP